jgi:hypothetical protein
MTPTIHGETPMKTHEIEVNQVPAASSPTGAAPEAKPPRIVVPLPSASADEPGAGTSNPVEGPNLVVVPSPDPPGIKTKSGGFEAAV